MNLSVPTGYGGCCTGAATARGCRQAGARQCSGRPVCCANVSGGTCAPPAPGLDADTHPGRDDIRIQGKRQAQCAGLTAEHEHQGNTNRHDRAVIKRHTQEPVQTFRRLQRFHAGWHWRPEPASPAGGGCGMPHIGGSARQKLLVEAEAITACFLWVGGV